jgi:hypothetical protein
MDYRQRERLEHEIAAHRRKIAEFAQELCHVEAIAARIARVPGQLMRHAALLRVALKGRRAAQEIVAERLATNYAR